MKKIAFLAILLAVSFTTIACGPATSSTSKVVATPSATTTVSTEKKM